MRVMYFEIFLYWSNIYWSLITICDLKMPPILNISVMSDSMDVAHQVLLSMESSRPRILEWVAFPFSTESF